MLSRLLGFCVVLLVLHAGPVRAQTMDQVQAMAQHLEQITQVSQQFLVIMDASSQLDNLAYAIAEGSIAPQQARARAADIHRELKGYYDQASITLDQLGPSRFKGQPEIHGRVAAYFATAEATRSMTLDFLNGGLALVETAAAGDPEVFARVELRALQNSLQSLHFQNGALEDQRSYEEPGTWFYEYSTAVLHQNLMMVAFLEESVVALETGAPFNHQRMMVAAREHYSQSQAALERSRQNAAVMYGQVRGQPGTSPSMEALLDYLFNDNIPRSLDVEDGLRETILEFVAGIGTLSDADLDRLTNEMLAFEEERLRLTSERQRAISGG